MFRVPLFFRRVPPMQKTTFLKLVGRVHELLDRFFFTKGLAPPPTTTEKELRADFVGTARLNIGFTILFFVKKVAKICTFGDISKIIEFAENQTGASFEVLQQLVTVTSHDFV